MRFSLGYSAKLFNFSLESFKWGFNLIYYTNYLKSIYYDVSG